MSIDKYISVSKEVAFIPLFILYGISVVVGPFHQNVVYLSAVFYVSIMFFYIVFDDGNKISKLIKMTFLLILVCPVLIFALLIRHFL